jgi:hypothetical protein
VKQKNTGCAGLNLTKEKQPWIDGRSKGWSDEERRQKGNEALRAKVERFLAGQNPGQIVAALVLQSVPRPEKGVSRRPADVAHSVLHSGQPLETGLDVARFCVV